MKRIEQATLAMNKMTEIYLDSILNGDELKIEEKDRDQIEGMVRVYINPFCRDEEGNVVDIKLDVSGVQVPIRTDFSRFTHIFQNLLSNAVRHRNGKGLDIIVRSTERETVLVVRDYGKGMTDADQGRIFKKRFAKQTNGSTGLGLLAAQSHIMAL